MHDHRFVFTSEHNAICEDITCGYRYSKTEILRLLFELANEESAQQPRAVGHGGTRPDDSDPGIQISGKTVDGYVLPPCR